MRSLEGICIDSDFGIEQYIYVGLYYDTIKKRFVYLDPYGSGEYIPMPCDNDIVYWRYKNNE